MLFIILVSKDSARSCLHRYCASVRQFVVKRRNTIQMYYPIKASLEKLLVITQKLSHDDLCKCAHKLG